MHDSDSCGVAWLFNDALKAKMSHSCANHLSVNADVTAEIKVLQIQLFLYSICASTKYSKFIKVERGKKNHTLTWPCSGQVAEQGTDTAPQVEEKHNQGL